jgi:hypothetical protein
MKLQEKIESGQPSHWQVEAERRAVDERIPQPVGA